MCQSEEIVCERGGARTALFPLDNNVLREAEGPAGAVQRRKPDRASSILVTVLIALSGCSRGEAVVETIQNLPAPIPLPPRSHHLMQRIPTQSGEATFTNAGPKRSHP